MQTETHAAFSVKAQQTTSSNEANANLLVTDLPECNGLKINAGIGFPAFPKLSSGDDDSNEGILLCSWSKKTKTKHKNQDIKDKSITYLWQPCCLLWL